MNITTETQHVYELSTWTWCPRVQYLKSRYIDLHKRFSRTAGAFPASLHDKNILNQLSVLCTLLGKHPRLIVTGDNVELKELDILPKDADCKTEDKLEVEVFCKRDLQLENWKQYRKQLMIQTEDGESRLRVDIIIVGTCSSTTNEENADSIASLKTWLSEKETGIPVKVFPTQKELLNEIEKILEVHIMRGFEQMYSYMHQYFIRKSITYDIESTDVLNLDMIVAVVKDTVQDGDLSCRSRKHADTATDSFEIEVMPTICRRMLYAIVSPLAAKYNIPEFLCYHVLMELQFEITISKAVSKNTRYRLSKLCHEQTKHNSSSTLSGKVLHNVDISAQSLRADLQNEDVIKTVDRNFQTAQRVTTVMRKMTFEIKGYLRQSLVSSSILDIETPRPKISDKLRHDILRMKSVYGVGTVYGELEINLRSKSEKSESDVKTEIAEQMKKHQYLYPYIVRTLDKEPEHFVRQGDKLLRRYMISQFCVGSVGCFVKDQQGQSHLITCAHVFSPGNNSQLVLTEENVNGVRHRYGLSTALKRIHSGDNVNFPLVDIAAVCAADDDKIRGLINYTMRDDRGEPKSVSFLCDMSEDLVGTTVYKHGASTHLTYGLISSSDVCIAENNPIAGPAEEYIMLIENSPDISDNDKVLDGPNNEIVNFEREEQAMRPSTRSFTEPGDSGAVICFNDYYVDPTGTIIAATMLSAGDYRIKEDDSSPKCLGFMLARGLEILSSRGHYFTM